ncbi:MAG: hypothetical protein EHM91_08765 [Planctomycetota bacterium]|nr:MAG: hypothetical protein EHM91_08765 [Planctomycetota bacterium]
MRTFAVAAMLVALATTAFAQDPHRNRMNDPYPEARQWDAAEPSSVSPYVNRMNVQYGESVAPAMTGGPNPYGNRMNEQVPTSPPKPREPKLLEKVGELKPIQP